MTIETAFGHRSGPLSNALGRIFSTNVVNTISVGVFSLIVLGTLALAYFNPVYNWDILAYVGIAVEDRLETAEEIHATAYKEVQDAASDLQFYKVTASIPYRVGQYENPEHFVSLFPMYRVKVAYTEAIKILGDVAGHVHATTIISTASAALVGFIIIVWSFRQDFVQGLLVVGPVAILIGYVFSAREATPDLMMAVFSLPAIYFVCREKPLFAAPFLYLMFLVRPDGILLFFALLLASLALGKHRLIYLGLFVACVFLYFPVVGSADHPGWWTHFYFSNIEYQDDMRGFAPAFDATLYVKALVVNLARTVQAYDWLMLLAVFLFGFVLLVRSGREISKGQWIAVIALTLCIGGKFVTFPLPDDRIYLPYMLPLLLVLMEIWRPEFSYPTERIRSDQ
ncbi:unnamed protein product [Effrenium voratum]|uniref:Glycosyltransferase RgtA/B/C/D-like domain-containing protein n=1 Tax=Effrenium voratum TaxID=2562239 RepID=A0AA36HIW3_9DINO|nr:unnamed protein product [Effrenium voratum]